MAKDSNININISFSGIQDFLSDLISRISHLNAGGVALVILAVIMPPIAVLLKVGFTTQFWVNILLTVLGFIPGQIHALWIILY